MRVLSLVLVCTAVVHAQIPQTTMTAMTDGPVAALAQIGTNTAFQVTAASTPVAASPNNLSLVATLNTGGYASAITTAYPTQPYQGQIGVNFFERAYARGTSSEIAGTSASAAQQGASHGPHALRVTFQNNPGVSGKIVFSFRANASIGGVTAGSIDVGADGTVEYSTTASGFRELPFTFGTAGSVVVKVTNECRIAGSGNAVDFMSAWTEMWVGFRPDLTATSTFTNYGTSCGGVSATGTDVVIGSNRVLTFLVTGGFTNSVVLSATGSQQLAVPLPGGCNLLCTAESVRLLQSDNLGNATDSYVLPSIAVGTTFHQFLPLNLIGNNLVLTASNGVRVSCVR